MARWLAPSLLLTALLAGCVDADDPLPDPSADTLTFVDGMWEGIPGPGDLPAPTLDTEPDYVRGEWWTYKTSGAIPEATGETVKIIAADVTETHWKIGMDQDAFDDGALASHFPVQGDVKRGTFEANMHGMMMDYLRFPLEEGSFDTNDGGTATVTHKSDTLAEVLVTGGMVPLRYTYDAEVRNFAFMDFGGSYQVELVDHGFGHTGRVIVPEDLQLSIFEARAAGVADASTPTMIPSPVGLSVGAPAAVVAVPDHDAGSLLVYAGTFGLPVVTPGVYAERATAPDGTVYSVTRTPADGTGNSVFVGQVQNPGGDWTMVHAAGGVGIVFTELVSYDLLVVDLVDGAVQDRNATP